MKYRLIMFFMIAKILLGCVGVPVYGPTFSVDSVGVVSSESAKIVVYKKGINTTNNYAGSRAKVKLDGKTVGDITEGSYIVLDVDPGIHKVTVGVPFMNRPVQSPIMFGYQHVERAFVGGEIYYFNYHIIAYPIGKTFLYAGSGAGMVDHQDFKDVTFKEVSEADALVQLESCKLLQGFAPVVTKK